MSGEAVVEFQKKRTSSLAPNPLPVTVSVEATPPVAVLRVIAAEPDGGLEDVETVKVQEGLLPLVPFAFLALTRHVWAPGERAVVVQDVVKPARG